MIAMIGTSDRLCWLAETCKILLLLLLSVYEEQLAVKLLTSLNGRAQVTDGAMQHWRTWIQNHQLSQSPGPCFALDGSGSIHSHAA